MFRTDREVQSSITLDQRDFCPACHPCCRCLHSDWTIFSGLLYLARDCYRAANIDMTRFAHLLQKRAGSRDLNRESTRFDALRRAFNGSVTAARDVVLMYLTTKYVNQTQGHIS